MKMKTKGVPVALLLSVMMGSAVSAQEQQQQQDINAPVGEQGIPRQDPGQYQPQPGQQTYSQQPNLPARELTREELEKIRQGMVDRTEGMILKPNEVGRIRDATLGSTSAAVRPTYSTDPYPSALPRVVNAAKTPMQTPPTVRMAFGLTTPVTFVDSDGYPWPVANVTYNPQMIAQDGAGCGNATGAQASEAGERPTTINLTPCYFEVFGNINVALDKWPYPIVLLTQSGFRPQGGQKVSIDMPLTVVIEGRSPLAEKVKPVPLSARNTPRSGKNVARRPVPEGDLATYIIGRIPAGAQSVALEGAPDLRGYTTPGGDLVVVGRVEMLTPNFAQKAPTPDGETAYRFKGQPYRLLFSDRSGVERPATVRY
ncbi:DotH/IcmK family type IV secretion protein [Agrobacterium tumefaciens]